MASLKYLPDIKNLIVKPADKGGAIVIWPRDDYLREASKQLENTAHYQHITHNPFPNPTTRGAGATGAAGAAAPAALIVRGHAVATGCPFS